MSILSSTNLTALAVRARWGEPHFTEAINKSRLGVQRGIIRGLRLEPVAGGISVRVAMDETYGDGLAAFEKSHLAFVVELTSAQVVSLAGWRDSTVYVALYATYVSGSPSTCVLRLCDAAETAETWWADAVKLGRIDVPAAGDLTAADIDTSIADYAWAHRGYGDVEWENLAPTPAMDHWHNGLPVGWHKIDSNLDDPEQSFADDGAGVPPTSGVALRLATGMSQIGMGEFTVHAGERIHVLLRGRGVSGTVTLGVLSMSPDGLLGIHADESRTLALVPQHANWTNLSASFVAAGNRSVLVSLMVAADSEAFVDEIQILREPVKSKLRRVVDRTRQFGNIAGRALELWTSLYEDAAVAMRVSAEGIFDQFRDATPTFTFKGQGGAAAILAGIKQISGVAGQDVTLSPAANGKVKLTSVGQVATPTAASTGDTDVVPDDIATVAGDFWGRRFFASGAAFLYGAATSTTRFAKVLAQGGALLTREAAAVQGGGGFVFLGDAKRGPADLPAGFEQKPYYGSEAAGIYRIVHPSSIVLASASFKYNSSSEEFDTVKGCFGLASDFATALYRVSTGIYRVRLAITTAELALLTGGDARSVMPFVSATAPGGENDVTASARAYTLLAFGNVVQVGVNVSVSGTLADNVIVNLRVYPGGATQVW